MSNQFLDFNTLEQDVVYTVRSFQYLYGTTGYFYVIRFTKPDNTVYYMNVREGTTEGNLYDKLQTIRTGSEKKRFTFTKTNVRISSTLNTPFIIISGENDIVNLV